MDKIQQVLLRCREIGLTISKKKLSISTSLSFAGYVISSKGVEPDPEKVAAIRDFPSPVDVTAVRSFLGLANQFTQYLPDLAMATAKIRGLLKKGIVFQWLPEHEEEFVVVKQLLTSPLLVHYFDASLPTSLLSDASKLNGLGYVLLQHAEDGKVRLIQAGSRSLTPAEGNYAPIEQECLGAVWAMEKCRYFLKGCPTFLLVTDHQPLIGIFKKDLSEVENRRLQRFRERVLDYTFTVEWVEGKTHCIADALSRYPLQIPDSLLDQTYHVSAMIHSLDPSLDSLRQAAADCDLYQRLVHAVRTFTKQDVKNMPNTDPLAVYKQVWDDLSLHTDDQLVLYQCDRIVVPVSERPRLLEALHLGHSGIAKT